MGEPFSQGIIQSFMAGRKIRQEEEDRAREEEGRKLKMDLLKDQMNQLKRQKQIEDYHLKSGTQGAITPGLTGQPASDPQIDLGGGNIQKLSGSGLPGQGIAPQELSHAPMQVGDQMLTPPNKSEVLQDLLQKYALQENLKNKLAPETFDSSAMGIFSKKTGQVTTPAPPKEETQPPIIKEWLAQVQEDIKAGIKPQSLREYQNEDANRKTPRTTINVGGSGLDSRILSRVTSISNQFDSNPVIKNYNEQWNRVEGVKTILSRPWSGPGDMATVYEFMKALDPTSVVRESEYANAAQTGNLFKGWAAKFNGYINPQGGFLSDQVKKDFLDVLVKRVAVSKGQVKKLHGDFSRRIDNLTGKAGTGEQFLTDYSELYEDTSESDTTIGSDEHVKAWKARRSR